MQRSQTSKRSNLLEAMSDGSNVYEDDMVIKFANGKATVEKSPTRSEKPDSGSELMEFNNDP